MHRCKRGHPLRGDADYDTALLKLGKRRCGRCAAEYRREWKRRKRREAGVRPRDERKTVCNHGHPLVSGNLRRGGRGCLTCHRESERRRQVLAGRRVHGPVWPRCRRGHDLTVTANRRPGRTDCAICHRLRSLKDAKAIDYGETLLGDPCSYCGAPCQAIDHIDAFANGGPNAWDNLTAACWSCNSRKRTRPLLVFMLDRAVGIA
jgi:5-methylcytosine-specific restriction endonuclease McrA